MSAVRPLPPDRLYRPADISKLSFTTTAELQPIDGLIGQQRALDAINFGTRIDKPGFNLFVIGPNGARMQEAVKAVLQEEAAPGQARPTGFTSTISRTWTSRSRSSCPRVAPASLPRRCMS